MILNRKKPRPAGRKRAPVKNRTQEIKPTDPFYSKLGLSRMAGSGAVKKHGRRIAKAHKRVTGMGVRMAGGKCKPGFVRNTGGFGPAAFQCVPTKAKRKQMSRKYGKAKKASMAGGRSIFGKLKKMAPSRKTVGALRTAAAVAERGSSGKTREILKTARLLTSKDKSKRQQGADLALKVAMESQN